MTDDLKPCPFCGGHAHWCMCAEGGCHRIECDACQFQLDTLNEKTYTDDCDTVDKRRALMAAAWNRREGQAVPVLPPDIPLQPCAPISLEWMARRTGHREGYNGALARVREVNPGVQFGTVTLPESQP